MGVPRLAHAASASVGVWWPTDGAHVIGTQPFKALVDGMSVDQYDMYWQVDGGGLVLMPSSYTGYPHKETAVDLSGWNWKGKGPYIITFVAKQNGVTITQRSVSIYNDSAPALAQAQTAVVLNQQTQTQTQTAPITTTTTATQATPSTASGTTAQTQTQPAAMTAGIDVWWPTAQASISGVTPFKALAKDMPVDSYTMYWQVDGGGLVPMPSSYTGYPHKETMVDVSGWNWNSGGTYTITFTAKNASGNVIAVRQIPVIVKASQTAQTITAPAAPIAPVQTVGTRVNDTALYVNLNSSAAAQANSWRTSRPADARAMDMLAAQPTAVWFGGWNANIYDDVHALVQNAAAQGKTAVMIAYNIPQRDCGGFSAGGVGSPDAYRSWIGSLASAIGGGKAIVVLEPDALAGIACLSAQDQQTRFGLLAGAVNTLKNNPNTSVYLDAGHSAWVDAGTMAGRLQSANIARADGFALNVSNFQTTADSTAYGTQISQRLGGKHFVIDTARNGLGSNGQWCNPDGRAIGFLPTLQTGNPLVDAYLWMKVPGESDGPCNGGPAAGQWWPDYALGLVQRSAYAY